MTMVRPRTKCVLHTLVVYVYEEVRLFLEEGSVACGRDYARGIVVLCVWRIERESLLCWYECDVSDVSNRERICGRNLENVQRKNN